MGKNIVIGNSAFSQLLAEYMEEDGIFIDAFSVEAEYIKTPELYGKSVISLQDLKGILSTRADTALFGDWI